MYVLLCMIVAAYVYGIEMLTAFRDNTWCSIGNNEKHSSTHHLGAYMMSVQILSVLGIGTLLRFFLPRKSRQEKTREAVGGPRQESMFLEWQSWAIKYFLMATGFIALWMIAFASVATTCLVYGTDSFTVTEAELKEAQAKGVFGAKCRDGIEDAIACENYPVGYVGIVMLTLMIVCALSSFNLTNENTHQFGQIRGSHIHFIETLMRLISSCMGLHILFRNSGWADYENLTDNKNIRMLCPAVLEAMEDSNRGKLSIYHTDHMKHFTYAMVAMVSIEFLVRVCEMYMAYSKSKVSNSKFVEFMIWWSYILTFVNRIMTGVLFLGFVTTNSIWSCPAFLPSKYMNVFYGILAINLVLAPMNVFYIKSVESTNNKNTQNLEKTIDDDGF